MKTQYLAKNLGDLNRIAQDLLPIIQERKIIAFVGEIGAGKTTFIKQLCHLLGVEDVTSSPTFAIINEYESDHEKVHHIDLYRLKSEEEAFSIGLMELFEGNNYCFVEWPDVVENYFPEESIWIRICAQENEERVFDVYYED